MANPIEPPPYQAGPFATRFKNVKGSTSRPASSPAMLDPLETIRAEDASRLEMGRRAFPSLAAIKPEPQGHIRYDLGDGSGMREWQSGREPSVGTVSMMTAPENVDRVTFASQMDDLGIQSALAGKRREIAMMQPYQPGQALPPLTVGEAVQRESAQETLRRLEAREAEIEKDRLRYIEDNLPSAMTSDDQETVRSRAANDAFRAYQRALMAEQLAMGKGLPGSVYDRRY